MDKSNVLNKLGRGVLCTTVIALSLGLVSGCSSDKKYIDPGSNHDERFNQTVKVPSSRELQGAYSLYSNKQYNASIAVLRDMLVNPNIFRDPKAVKEAYDLLAEDYSAQGKYGKYVLIDEKEAKVRTIDKNDTTFFSLDDMKGPLGFKYEKQENRLILDKDGTINFFYTDDGNVINQKEEYFLSQLDVEGQRLFKAVPGFAISADGKKTIILGMYNER